MLLVRNCWSVSNYNWVAVANHKWSAKSEALYIIFQSGGGKNWRKGLNINQNAQKFIKLISILITFPMTEINFS